MPNLFIFTPFLLLLYRTLSSKTKFLVIVEPWNLRKREIDVQRWTTTWQSFHVKSKLESSTNRFNDNVTTTLYNDMDISESRFSIYPRRISHFPSPYTVLRNNMTSNFFKKKLQTIPSFPPGKVSFLPVFEFFERKISTRMRTFSTRKWEIVKTTGRMISRYEVWSKRLYLQDDPRANGDWKHEQRRGIELGSSRM